MAAVGELLDRARQCHQAGDLRRAEQLYQQVLEVEPGNAEVWHLLGQACQGQGKLAEAAASYQHALRLQPQAAEACFRLGAVLAEQGQRDEALAQYRQAVRLRPDHAEALTCLGVALAERKELGEAVALLAKAVQCRPDYAKAHYNLGIALAELGKAAEAAGSLERTLELRPDYAAAHYALGNLLASQGKREEAIARYRQAVALRPDYGEALNNLGLALTEAGRPAEAAILLEQAVRLRPRAAEAHNNLGLALADLGRFAEAEACYREALRLNPRYAEAHNNLGSAYKEQDRLEEALACYQLALWLDPDAASTRWNRALALLKQGDFAQGWPEYEWRWRRKKARPRRFPQPAWDGSPLEGKTLLVYMEQGLGDMIQFLRYAPLARRRGGSVVVECPGFLAPLFSTCPGIDRLVAEGAPLPAFDVQAPLLSLPRLLATTLETIPAEVPYLSAEPGRVERWREELTGLDGFKVGITWQGNRHHQWDRHRSFPLAGLAPLARVPGVRLISLQKGPGEEQLRRPGRPFPVTELGSEKDAASAAFQDTAAIMRNLDLVISADTAVAHLAGALGVPVWVALSRISDWRWLVGREDSPWYPTLRLFRQRELGDWEGVFRRMGRELRKVSAAGAGKGG